MLINHEFCFQTMWSSGCMWLINLIEAVGLAIIVYYFFLRKQLARTS